MPITKQEIDNGIIQLAQQFWSKLYDDFVPLGTVDKVKDAIVIIPQEQWPLSNDIAKAIVEKRDNELTNVEVRLAVLLIRKVPLDTWFANLSEALMFSGHMERIIADIAAKANDINTALERQRNRKYQLAGLTNAAQLLVN